MARKLFILLTIALVAIGVVYLAHERGEVPTPSGEGGVVGKTSGVMRPRRSMRPGNKAHRIEEKTNRQGGKPAVPPSLEQLVDDDADIDDELRTLISELQAALDESNRDRAMEIVQSLLHRAYGGNAAVLSGAPGTVPKWAKVMAVKSIGWFGSSVLPEIAGFLADESPEVVQAALEQYELALMDFSLGDRDRSLILTSAAKIIDDVDSMNILLFELNNMRHSVAVDAMKTMMVYGSAATKAALPENVSFYTGEDGLDTPEKLDAWLANNPDDKYDEDFYGPIVSK